MKKLVIIVSVIVVMLFGLSCSSFGIKRNQETNQTNEKINQVVENTEVSAIEEPTEYVYETRESMSESGTANPDEETHIALEDGAEIVIPKGAIDDQILITLERNPEMNSSLPPVEDGFIQLSDFYKFEFVGGNLIQGVDFIIPVDENILPEGDGLLTVATMSESGWEYAPVSIENGKVIYYTHKPGISIITWHAITIENIEKYKQESDDSKTMCDANMILDVYPQNGETGDEIVIRGYVFPLREKYTGMENIELELLDINPAANLPVIIKIGESNENMTVYGSNYFTNENGRFYVSAYVHETNDFIVSAEVDCGDWFETIPIKSEGFSTFEVTDQPAIYIESEQEIINNPIADTKVDIPVGAVELPYFIGQPIDDVISWLENKGFGYTWMEGSSIYELGSVYHQFPTAGGYYVPHRTMVVLYKTITQEEDLFGCANPSLTPEERVNCGEHTFATTFYVTNTTGNGVCSKTDQITGKVKSAYERGMTIITFYSIKSSTFLFADSSVQGGDMIWEKIENNTYKYPSEEWEDTIIFTMDGNYTTTYLGICRWIMQKALVPSP